MSRRVRECPPIFRIGAAEDPRLGLWDRVERPMSLDRRRSDPVDPPPSHRTNGNPGHPGEAGRVGEFAEGDDVPSRAQQLDDAGVLGRRGRAVSHASASESARAGAAWSRSPSGSRDPPRSIGGSCSPPRGRGTPRPGRDRRRAPGRAARTRPAMSSGQASFATGSRASLREPRCVAKASARPG